MNNKRYAMNVSIMLGISVVLMLFVFVFVAHHRDVPNRVRQDSGALLDTGSSWAERIKAVGQDGAASAETQQKPK